MRNSIKCRTQIAAWAATIAAMVIGMAPDASQAQHAIPFANDFTSTGFTNTTSAVWTYDDVNDVLNYNQPSGGGVVVATASEEITGAGASDFVMSARFTLNDLQGALNPIAVGLGLFGSASDFGVTTPGNAYYLADWSFGGSGVGALRILKLQQGSSNQTIASGGNAGLGEIGKTYEMRITATRNEGALDMTIAVFDDLGTLIGTEATGSDATPLTGAYFGIRNRTAHSGHALNIEYRSFSISGPAGPQNADFDDDDDVDGVDFLIWQRGFGAAGGLSQGDANDDNAIDGADLGIWRSQFGSSPGVVAASMIPEPSALALAVVSSTLLVVQLGGVRRQDSSHA